MSGRELGRAPRSDAEWALQVHRRLNDLEHRSTARAGGWVLTEQGDLPVLTKPGQPPIVLTPAAGGGDTAVESSPYVMSTVDWIDADLDEGTVFSSGDQVVLTAPSGSGSNLQNVYQDLAIDTGYRVTAHIEAAWYPSGTVRCGLVLRQSSDGKAVVFAAVHDSGAKLTVSKYNSNTSFNANYVNQSVTDLPYGMPQWLRISDDSTNRVCEFSYNGQDWVELHSVSRTDFLTADQVGVTVMNASSGKPATLRMRSFEQAALVTATGEE